MPSKHSFASKRRSSKKYKQAPSIGRKSQYRRFSGLRHGETLSRSFDFIPHESLPPVNSNGKPVLIENRPHKDTFFPVNGREVMHRISKVPEEDVKGITHIWLRRTGPKEDRGLGTYSYGPSYAVIILYPWPTSLRLQIGHSKPDATWRWIARNFNCQLVQKSREWFAEFTLSGARNFILNDLIFHEIGHHVDPRRFSSTHKNWKAGEEYANQYALRLSRLLSS